MVDNLLDISGAAAYLSVSRATVYRLISKGNIRTYRILNHAVRIRQRELDEFVDGTLENDNSNGPSSTGNQGPVTGD